MLVTAGLNMFRRLGRTYLWSPSCGRGVVDVAGHGMLDVIIPAEKFVLHSADKNFWTKSMTIEDIGATGLQQVK